MQSCIHDERGKTGRMGKLQEGCNLGSKHNPVLTCEKRNSIWKALEKKKKPGSLLGDLRQALLESLPIFLKQLTWTAGPGGSSQDRQALAP